MWPTPVLRGGFATCFRHAHTTYIYAQHSSNSGFTFVGHHKKLAFRSVIFQPAHETSPLPKRTGADFDTHGTLWVPSVVQQKKARNMSSV